jgi:hypothetical protein
MLIFSVSFQIQPQRFESTQTCRVEAGGSELNDITLFYFLMWVPAGILVSTHKDLSEIPVGIVDPWVFGERIFTDLGAKFSAQIPVGTDPGHPPVHLCPALRSVPQKTYRLGTLWLAVGPWLQSWYFLICGKNVVELESR